MSNLALITNALSDMAPPSKLDRQHQNPTKNCSSFTSPSRYNCFNANAANIYDTNELPLINSIDLADDGILELSADESNSDTEFIATHFGKPHDTSLSQINETVGSKRKQTAVVTGYEPKRKRLRITASSKNRITKLKSFRNFNCCQSQPPHVSIHESSAKLSNISNTTLTSPHKTVEKPKMQHEHANNKSSNVFDSSVSVATSCEPGTYGAAKHVLFCRSQQIRALDQSKWYATGYSRLDRKQIIFGKTDNDKIEWKHLKGTGFQSEDSSIFSDVVSCTDDMRRLVSAPSFVQKFNHARKKKKLNSEVKQQCYDHARSFMDIENVGKRADKQDNNKTSKTDSTNDIKTISKAASIERANTPDVIATLQKQSMTTIEKMMTRKLESLPNLYKGFLAVAHLKMAQCYYIGIKQVNEFLMNSQLLQQKLKSLSFTQNSTLNEVITSTPGQGFGYLSMELQESSQKLIKQLPKFADFQQIAVCIANGVGSEKSFQQSKNAKYSKIKTTKNKNQTSNTTTRPVKRKSKTPVCDTLNVNHGEMLGILRYVFI